tara:strand:- start:1325 stop:1822 length:498 start_codon:yes stop_codon:yes gene_type:complete
LNIIVIIITIGILFSNERQNNLEQHIQCPCEKGMLINHASPSAMKLKKLISLLISESIHPDNIAKIPDTIKKYIQETKFVSNDRTTQNDENLDIQICLISEINKKISDYQISDTDIYDIIGNCYGENLIKNNKSNSLIYFILFFIILIGAVLSLIFIAKNKRGRL